MTYFMSDLHGQYDKYVKMLKKIAFSSRDCLFVVGDVVDRGPEPMAILRDMALRPNVYPVLGNHDAAALHILTRLNEKITAENLALLDRDFLSALSLWRSDGGEETLQDFRKLSPDEREGVLDFLTDFALYEEVTVGSVHYVLVHAGIGNFVPEKPLNEYDPADLIDGRADYGRQYFEDAVLVTGHTPTLHIDPSYEGAIWRGNGHIALDCGAGFGFPLGCLRVEDGQEFYVD